MKSILASIAALFLLSLTACGTTAQLFTSTHESYAAVRDISLLAPKIAENKVVVPLDLSQSKFTSGLNSGLVIRKIKTITDHQNIYFYLVSTLAGGSLTLQGQPSIDIRNPKHNTYTAFYLDPDGTKNEIGLINIMK